MSITHIPEIMIKVRMSRGGTQFNIIRKWNREMKR